MNLYLDTSSLAKLYVDEIDSAEIRDRVHEATIVVTSTLSYAEMWSVAARRRRERILSAREAGRILDVFESDWNHFGKINVDHTLLKEAGRLLMKYPLRALDAIQLASALSFRHDMDEPVVFASADERLQWAARREKLKILA